MRLALPPLTPAIKGLLIANVAVFLVTAFATNFLGSTFIQDYLGVQPALVFKGYLWQPFTYMWIHSTASLGHLFSNMLMLYFFGGFYESSRGSRGVVQTYLATGLAGGLAVVLVGGAWHIAPVSVQYFDMTWSVSTIGASGSALGIFSAWCGLFWNQTKSFFILGPIKVNNFFYFFLVLQLLSAVVLDGSSTAAHLGGMAAGLAIGRNNLLGRANVWWERRKLLAKQAELQKELDRFTVIDGGRDDEDENGDDWIH